MKLFLCGDVMTGRGIDQILPRPADAQLHEPYVRSALDYVRIAEALNGPIPRAVPPTYIWGQAPDVLREMQSDVRVVNRETAVTRRLGPEGHQLSDEPRERGVPGRGAARLLRPFK